MADLRIFTPTRELPLAGHPILGCAYVLQQLQALPQHFILNTQAKPVRINTENGNIALAIEGYQIQASRASKEQLAECLGPAEKYRILGQ